MNETKGDAAGSRESVKTAITALTSRGMRGGLDSQDSYHLCELVRGEMQRTTLTVGQAISLVELLMSDGNADEGVLHDLHCMLLELA